MTETRNNIGRHLPGWRVAALLVTLHGCSHQPPQSAALKRLAPGAEFAGFLSDYSKLKMSPRFENTLAYVKQHDARNIHKYIAVIVDPVEIYVATNADPSKIPDRGRTALAEYFQNAITRAVGDAFPIVQEPGVLVLRLRSALVGVDTGGQIEANPSLPGVADALARAVDIGSVYVEIEMVDSMTGEQIAAAVDKKNLGDGVVVGSATFAREERFAAAKEAFDGWASRLRDFLDSAHERSQQDEQRADGSYQPYGEAPQTNR